MIYQRVLKPLLFQLDPEDAHHLVLTGAALCSKSQVLANLIAKFYGANKNRDQVKIMGLNFPNRLGLAAGFDKNCEAFSFLEALGFGHIEIGTVTIIRNQVMTSPGCGEFLRIVR
jgi:dihydroorotate dehydrogenase